MKASAFAWFFLIALCASTVRGGPADRITAPGTVALDSAAALRRGRVVRTQLTEEENNTRMPFWVALRMRDLDGLRARIYRGEIIPPDEMSRRYYPKEEDYARVAAWLRSGEIETQAPDVTRLAVFGHGTPAQLARHLRTRFARVATTEGKEVTAALDAPSLPAEFADLVLAVRDLQPQLKPKPRPLGLPGPFADNDSFVGPNEIRSWYGLDQLNLDGSGQEIAVLGIAVRPSDLTTFWTNVGSPHTMADVTFANVDPNNLDKEALDQEICMDIEWASAMAPKAKIRVYGYPSDGPWVYIPAILADLPTHPNLRQVSSSIGLGAESAEDPVVSQYYAALAAAGVTYFNGSGDNGLISGNGISAVVFSPANDPCTVGVGMTWLNFKNPRVLPEIVTSETGLSSSGGGTSGLWPRPSWQKGPGVPAGTMRVVPDVAIFGQANRRFYTVVNGGVEQGGGGTSLAAPVWTGLCALINQSRANAGLAPVGLITPRLYPLIGTDAFHDITIDDFGYDPVTGTHVGPGWDNSSGIGTPNLPKLIAALAGSADPHPALASSASQSGDQHLNVGDTVTLTVVPTTPSDSPILAYQWQRVIGIDEASGLYWDPVAESDRVSGTTTPVLTIKNFQKSDGLYDSGPNSFKEVYSYRLAMQNQYGWGYSNRIFLFNGPAPVITLQPKSTTVVAGKQLLYLIVEPNDAKQYLFRWYKNGIELPYQGANAAADSQLGFPTVQPSDAGDYYVVLTGAGGQTQSATATLTVLPATPTPTPVPTPTPTPSPSPTPTPSPTPSPTPTPTARPTPTVTPTPTPSPTPSPTPTPTPTSSQLYSISTRSFVGTSGSVQIAGFVIGGTEPKQVLIRASGPALAAAPFGIAGTLDDPVLELHNATDTIATNDDWDPALAPTFTRLGAFSWTPGSKDAALLLTLNPGAYTAIVRGKNTATGIALIEVYNADTAAKGNRLVAISTRSPTLTGANVQIAGFVVSGTQPKKVLVRASGPALAGAPFNVPGTLDDPTLTLYSGQTVIGSNDDWPASLAVTFTAVGAFAWPTGSKDAALIATLNPGPYTAIVQGKNGATGVTLVEVYEVP